MLESNKKTPSALENIRVLDLADSKGIYCARLLADLGSNVIKIEPPQGDNLRNRGPYYHDERDPEKSLYWFHFNANKRSVTLNLKRAEGIGIFKSLVKISDILIETFPPGHLDEMGLGYENLKEINPGLINTSITGFGSIGPWKDYKASDLVGSATGGLSYVCGWPDLPPLHMAGSYAYHQVSLQAAVATLIALYHRRRTGKGQKVEVSMHQSVVASLMISPQRYFTMGEIRKRSGDDRELPHFGLFRCLDGYVDFRFRDDRWLSLLEWLDSEGMVGDLKEEKWQNPLYRREGESIEHINEILRRFLKNHTRKEIYEEGQRRGLEIGSVYTAAEVKQDSQLAATGYFISIEHPELKDTITYLGPPYRHSETPWRIRRRAPWIGEHNEEVYEKELGLSRKEFFRLKEEGII